MLPADDREVVRPLQVRGLRGRIARQFHPARLGLMSPLVRPHPRRAKAPQDPVREADVAPRAAATSSGLNFR
jgi:hypothetical protein